MLLHCKRVFQKAFKNKVSKEAYLDACKWLAKNIYSNVELSKHIVISIEKQQRELPTFVVSVFVKQDEEEVKGDFCKHCKSLHTIFYSIDKVDCGECKANAYFKMLDDRLVNKAKFVKEVLEEKQNG